MDLRDLENCYDPDRGVVFPLSAHRVSEQSISNPQYANWPSAAIGELSAWLSESSDYERTLYLWGEAFIKCGSCKREWDAWCTANPIHVDHEAWLAAAEQAIRDHGWV